MYRGVLEMREGVCVNAHAQGGQPGAQLLSLRKGGLGVQKV